MTAITTGLDLLAHPPWREESLGRPLPDSVHAVSVSLPRWRDVIGYEEGDPAVTERMTLGYPRFVINPTVKRLVSTVTRSPNALPFPSSSCAEDCARFIHARSGARTTMHPLADIFIVETTGTGAESLKAFWQHTGRIVTSRQAEALLAGNAYGEQAAEMVLNRLTTLLAGLYGSADDAVQLYPTGMAAIYAALRAATTLNPGKRTIQLGFPYVDTLKLQEQFFGGACFILDKGEQTYEELEAALASESFAACICEVPGNPLLGSVDIPRLKSLLSRYEVPLIIDEAIATPYNCALHEQADLLVTSLTKYIAGTGDVMGGAIIRNLQSPYAAALHVQLETGCTERLWPGDAEVLAAQALNFPTRMQQHNRNGLYLAERLRGHPAVHKVWYPKWECASHYDAIRRPEGGWGGLLSFVLKDAERTTPMFFDRLRVCKGPTLGTVFTLACPFTLLAHYNELDWAESCGVSRYLIRVAVGIEPPAAIWSRFSSALAS